MIGSVEEAERLVRDGKRSAVLVFERDFSAKMHRCSFLTHADPPPLNPLYRDGINPAEVGLTIKKDPTQQAAASIIEQVAQVTLFRVIIPWMIGKAFERVGDEEFMQLVASQAEEEGGDPGAGTQGTRTRSCSSCSKSTFEDPKFDELSKKKFGALSAAFKAATHQSSRS